MANGKPNRDLFTMPLLRMELRRSERWWETSPLDAPIVLPWGRSAEQHYHIRARHTKPLQLSRQLANHVILHERPRPTTSSCTSALGAKMQDLSRPRFCVSGGSRLAQN